MGDWFRFGFCRLPACSEKFIAARRFPRDDWLELHWSVASMAAVVSNRAISDYIVRNRSKRGSSIFEHFSFRSESPDDRNVDSEIYRFVA